MNWSQISDSTHIGLRMKTGSRHKIYAFTNVLFTQTYMYGVTQGIIHLHKHLHKQTHAGTKCKGSKGAHTGLSNVPTSFCCCNYSKKQEAQHRTNKKEKRTRGTKRGGERKSNTEGEIVWLLQPLLADEGKTDKKAIWLYYKIQSKKIQLDIDNRILCLLVFLFVIKVNTFFSFLLEKSNKAR